MMAPVPRSQPGGHPHGPREGSPGHCGVTPAFDDRYPDLKLSPVVGLICAYEEEANIGAVLAAMPQAACGLPLSTLVVVDGGTDRTDQVSIDSGAITFVLSENLGQGLALRVGYALCMELGSTYVVTLDADGQNDPAEIPACCSPWWTTRPTSWSPPAGWAGTPPPIVSARPASGSSRGS